MLTRRSFVAIAAFSSALSVLPALAQPAGAVKTVTIVSRPNGVTAAQFVASLQSDYVELARKQPRQRGFIICGVVDAQPRSDVKLLHVSRYDAVIESHYANKADQEAAAMSEEGKALDAALARLVASARRFVTVNHVIVPIPAGPRPPIVGLTFVMAPDGVPPSKFRDEWIVVHGPMAQKVPYLRGFHVSERLSDAPVPGIPDLVMDAPLQGFTESWVNDVASRAKMIASPEAKEWYAHGAEIFGKVRTDLLIEHVIQPVEG